MAWKGILMGALGLPALAMAHPGHDGAGVLVEVAAAERVGSRVSVEAFLTNLGEAPAALTGIGAGAATVGGHALPLAIPADGTLRLTAELVYPGEVPGILSLDFRFGEEGSGPVLVIVEQGERADG